MNKKIVPIRGMHCNACEILIGEELKKISGVSSVDVNQRKALAVIEYPETVNINDEEIIKAVQAVGYQVGKKDRLPWISKNPADYKDLGLAVGIFLIIYFLVKLFNVIDLSINAPKSGVAVALLVGLVAGVSTCMALVGGLVLGLAARHAEQHPEASAMQKFRPHIFFNLGRILGFAFFGGLIGLIGQAFKPANNLLAFLTIAIGLVMIFFGLKLIEIFPALRDKNITLPSGIAQFFGLNNEIKEYNHKGAIIMGILTFFLPCGFTQAMQLYAISTGSFWQGMAIMSLFSLGTAPGLLGIGGLTSVFKGKKARIFFMIAGLVVITLGLVNIDNGSRLFGKRIDNKVVVPVVNQAAQEVYMNQTKTGYSPNIFTIKKNQPVKWVVNSETQLSCTAYLVMPSYGISEGLRAGENIINFTPTEIGEIPFSCSMGMYRGKFIVTE